MFVYFDKCEELCKSGYSYAVVELADFYFQKKYHQDYGCRMAAEYMTIAAKAGDIVAQCCLGIFYVYGVGVETDGTLGIEWLKKAAEQNMAYAQFTLGECYEKGDGTDMEKAEYYYKLAAENGNEEAVEKLKQIKL